MLKLVPLLIALPASALPASALQAETVDDINPTTRNPTFAPERKGGYQCTCPGFDYYSKDARSCADHEIPCVLAWPFFGSYCHDCRRNCGVWTVEDSMDCSRCWGKKNEFNGKDCCGHPHAQKNTPGAFLMANCVCTDCLA
mmetsp:Transcript_38219/g.123681  ORF Transcript_38219/g.123681 Transcript_38219/m.123681 type:complete len:141 (+) Transcript_38219:74-496(+)